jgi:tetratricopeptide (TPR) repeat protein
LLAQGEFALTLQHLETALNHRAEWVGDHDLYADLADAAAGAEDLETLLRYAPMAEAGADRYDHRLYKARAHRAWGVAHRLGSDYAKSKARLEAALAVFQEEALPWQSGRTFFELGLLALDRSKKSEAGAHLSQALDNFESMGARPDIDRTRSLLGSLA